MNVTVTELDLRSLDSGVVGFERFVGTVNRGARGFRVGFQCVVIRAQLSVLFAWHHALLDQGAIALDLSAAPVFTCNLAREVRLSLFLRGNIFGKVGLRLLEIRFERSRIDSEEQLASSDVRAVGKMNLRDASGNLWLN